MYPARPLEEHEKSLRKTESKKGDCDQDMSEDTVNELRKKAEEDPKNVVNWLTLIDAQLSAGIDMSIIGNTFLTAVKANPMHEELYSVALQSLDGFDLDDIILEIKEIREREVNKPRGFL